MNNPKIDWPIMSEMIDPLPQTPPPLPRSLKMKLALIFYAACGIVIASVAVWYLW